jgi:DNA-binding transcriptional MerR regulator
MSRSVQRMAKYRGQMLSIIEISEKTGIHPETLWYRAQKGIDLTRKPERSFKAANRGRASSVYKPRVKEESLFDDKLPYESDLRAQIAVSIAVQRGSGLSLEEVSVCMGLCRERVRQIERRAMRRIWAWAARNNEEKRLREWLQLLAEGRQESNAERVEAEAEGFSHEEYNLRRRMMSRERERAA